MINQGSISANSNIFEDILEQKKTIDTENLRLTTV